MEGSGVVTRLLGEWRQGNKGALDELAPYVYQELRRLARSCMKDERTEHTLQPTALIHEAYVRLVQQNAPELANRAHFFAVAAHIMRQVLVDFARTRRAAKRGSGKDNASLDDAIMVVAGEQRTQRLLELHDALDMLEKLDPRKASVIELRYFGGLSREEVAEALGLTLATVKRDLSLGEAFIRREMRGQKDKTG